MVKEARDYNYIDNGYDGFQDVLTGGFQNAGVYGHVLLQAGSYLYGGGIGQAVGYAFDAFDRLQQGLEPFYPHRENDQRPAEIRGNEAGTQVGSHMWNYITGHLDPKKLKQDLTEALCKPEGGT